MGVMATVSSAVGSVNKAIEAASAIKNADLTLALAEVKLKLAEVQGELAEMLSENTTLKGEKAQLEEQLRAIRNKTLEFKGWAYFGTDGSGPFCSACWETSKTRMTLKEESQQWSMEGTHSCPKCGTFFQQK